MSDGLSYAVVTPVRDEAENLERLARCLQEQTARPATWIIVDGGSVDRTAAIARQLADQEAWVDVVAVDEATARGGPIVRAFKAGLGAIAALPDVVVKLDADVSMKPDYFERLLHRFGADPRLGIASGTCFEEEGDEWRERHVTGDHVWGAARAYRASCLLEISPLEERMGWDGIDAFKAAAHGWRTATFDDLPFRHHRREGARERSRWISWRVRGEAMHYMGYRPSFVLARTVHRSLRDPSALALAFGWAASALRRKEQVADADARAALRRQQRLRALPRRALEAFGRRRPVVHPSTRT